MWPFVEVHHTLLEITLCTVQTSPESWVQAKDMDSRVTDKRWNPISSEGRKDRTWHRLLTERGGGGLLRQQHPSLPGTHTVLLYVAFLTACSLLLLPARVILFLGMLSVTFLSKEFKSYALVVIGHRSQKLRLAHSYLSIHPCFIPKTYFCFWKKPG